MDTDLLYTPYIDEKYKEFSSSLSLTDRLDRKGIRIPVLRSLAKTVKSDDITIKYHEDVILKGLSLGAEKIPTEKKLEKLTALLPFLTSWDQTDIIQSAFKPKKDDKEVLYSYFLSLLNNIEIYSKRLAIVWLMSNRKYYDRKKTLLAIINADDEKEYYISMAVAWAFSFFVIDDPTLISWQDKLQNKTRKRALQKLRDSKRFSFSLQQ